LWLEVPGPASNTVGQDLADYQRQYPKAAASFMEWIGWWASFQPIDLLLCTPGAWGYRFLTLTHRIIVGKVWDTGTFVALRAGTDLDAKHRASFEGASLRQRSLCFADLTASELFAGDLTGANLNGADLTGAINYGSTHPAEGRRDSSCRSEVLTRPKAAVIARAVRPQFRKRSDLSQQDGCHRR
jgi:Pentapeptide repeats (8 copies)